MGITGLVIWRTGLYVYLMQGMEQFPVGKTPLKPGNMLHSMAITVIVTSTVSSDACLGIFELVCTRNTGQIPKPSQ